MIGETDEGADYSVIQDSVHCCKRIHHISAAQDVARRTPWVSLIRRSGVPLAGAGCMGVTAGRVSRQQVTSETTEAVQGERMEKPD